ncbi:PepSY-associated TM helix domain-containing protein [Neptunicella sp. SCSIO 80796]|uniref:PepSY-associated TM helix domain-containing protein n=1 Tax=Neptunicella plasticusilytica TaxID=3117012 RepID=UPI003A4D2640
MTTNSHPNRNETSLSSRKLYRMIWRWHFYAGLLCIPFILTLAISGSIFLFKPQIENWIDQPFHALAVGATTSTPNQQIQAALDTLPGSRFVSYQLPKTPRHAVIIQLIERDIPWLVYINPYNLQVLKVIKKDSQFIELVRSFHGELLAGNTGSVLVELAGCWAIVLIVSGLYLWWPKQSHGLAGVFYPRVTKGKRLFWRDMHAVTGMWISTLALFLLITGLPWALVWGGAFKQVRGWLETPVEQDWTISRAQEHQHMRHQALDKVNLSPLLLASAEQLNLAPPATLSISDRQTQQWKLQSSHQNRMLRSNVWLDGIDGHIVKSENFSERKGIDKVIGIGISAHEGQLFGWFNQLLGLVTTSGLILMMASGFILWRRRKPRHSLGAPQAMPDSRAAKVILTTLVTMALLLPLLMISLIALWILERLVLTRIPQVRNWLGLTG